MAPTGKQETEESIHTDENVTPGRKGVQENFVGYLIKRL